MPKTLLLADDSITIQRVVELTFANEDVTVVAVDDGDRAIETLRKSPPDVVLADIAMPGRSGYEVAAYVRQQSDLRKVPVLLLAGAFDAVDQAQARDAGADGVLIKPFDPVVLVGRVRELLAGGHREPVAAGVQPATAPRAGAAAGEALPDIGHDAGPAPPASVRPSSPASSDADRYFEEIDQAFAALSKSPRPTLPASADDDGDGAERLDAGTEPPAGAAAARPVGLTDAFAALLDAERRGAPLTELPPSGAAHAPAAQEPPIDLDALADSIARRVLEQLSDRVVRDTVSGIVSATAERLVREEIDRIKRDIT